MNKAIPAVAHRRRARVARASALAKVKPKKKKPVVVRTIQGPSVNMQWGPIQVTVKVKGKKIIDITRDLSDRAAALAVHQLAGDPAGCSQEVLQAQSANVQLIGGATLTSEAYAMSLQAALQPGEDLTGRARSALEHVMGMPVGIDVRDGERVRGRRRPRRSTGSASSTRPSARTRRTARSAGSTAASSRCRTRTRTCGRCSSECERLREQTGGYFDARAAGDGLDPSGLVKGWSVDRAGAILDRLRRAQLVDLRRRRRPRARSSRRRGVAGASASSIRSSRDAIAAVVRGTDLALATSGEYERGAARPRPAHRAPAGGRPLGDDHRPRARHRRRATPRRPSRWAPTVPRGPRGSTATRP